MNPATLITVSDASTTLTTAAGFSVPIFAALIGLVAVVVGIIVGGLFVAVVVRATLAAVRTAFGSRRGGGRRRRR